MKLDAEIESDVMTELKWDPNLVSEHIGVSVNEKVVTLTGWVSSYAQKLEAEKVAEQVLGVQAVADELEVKLPGDSRRDDFTIAHEAAEILKRNPFAADGVKAVVDRGWLTLDGEVNWAYQKDALERAVRTLPGVVRVVNNLCVKVRMV